MREHGCEIQILEEAKKCTTLDIFSAIFGVHNGGTIGAFLRGILFFMQQTLFKGRSIVDPLLWLKLN